MDQVLFKALAHPLRQRLLAALNHRVASPSDLAEELGEPLGNVSYHVRILADLDCIELVGTTPRRGAVEHHYRATVRPFFSREQWKEIPLSVRRSISGETLSLIFNEAAEAMTEGALDSRDDRHLSRTQLVLDDEGWEEVTGLLARVLDRALEIQSEAADRGANNRGEPVTTRLVLMHYPAVTDAAVAKAEDRAAAS